MVTENELWKRLNAYPMPHPDRAPVEEVALWEQHARAMQQLAITSEAALELAAWAKDLAEQFRQVAIAIQVELRAAVLRRKRCPAYRARVRAWRETVN